MSHRTPWSQSSLPSDSIKPKPKKQPPNTPKNKGKAKENVPIANDQPAKSATVRALETTINKLQHKSGDQKDPKGGCFCLARTHELSPYYSLCFHCGLILCTINLPYYACPHCNVPLLSPTAKAPLLQRLRTELAETIAKEEEEADRAREDARQKAGAFPVLGSNDMTQQKQEAQSHKVLSLNAKTKRVTVASYTPPPPAPVRASQRPETPQKDGSPERVPALPQEFALAQGPPVAARPWIDLRGDGFTRTLTYVRDPRIDREQLKEVRKARKAKKKEVGGDDQDVGPSTH